MVGIIINYLHETAYRFFPIPGIDSYFDAATQEQSRVTMLIGMVFAQ